MADITRFIVNIVLTLTTTLSNGEEASDLHNSYYSLNRVAMLTEETARPVVQKILEALKIPNNANMHHVILSKIVGFARHITEGRPYKTLEGKPFVTLSINVDKGQVVKVVGEFDRRGHAPKRTLQDTGSSSSSNQQAPRRRQRL